MDVDVWLHVLAVFVWVSSEYLVSSHSPKTLSHDNWKCLVFVFLSVIGTVDYCQVLSVFAQRVSLRDPK